MGPRFHFDWTKNVPKRRLFAGHNQATRAIYPHTLCEHSRPSADLTGIGTHTVVITGIDMNADNCFFKTHGEYKI